MIISETLKVNTTLKELNLWGTKAWEKKKQMN